MDRRRESNGLVRSKSSQKLMVTLAFTVHRYQQPANVSLRSVKERDFLTTGSSAPWCTESAPGFKSSLVLREREGERERKRERGRGGMERGGFHGYQKTQNASSGNVNRYFML